MIKDRYSVYSSDVMLDMLSARYEFSDHIQDIFRRVVRTQLKDIGTWKICVAQFANSNKEFGVDDKDHGWRCEYWGKLMRGASFAFRVSRDEELYSILCDTVNDMLSTTDDLGRFSTCSLEKEFTGWDIWGRKYIMLGLIYFLDICREDEFRSRIVSALISHADYMISKLGREEDGKLCIAKCTRHWDGLNSCSILEPFMFLYNLTGEQRYLDFAEYVVSFGGTASTNLFDVMLKNETRIKDLPQRKAYEMMSCFEGLAEYVRVTGCEKYRTALKNFADRILTEEVSVIGCCGCDFESFDGTAESQFDLSIKDRVMQETCVTVTWMKFCYQILRMYGDVRYADALERSMYNAFCGAFYTEEEEREQTMKNGNIPLPVDSYSPLRVQTRKRETGGRKTIDESENIYGCCIAIAAAGFGISAFASIVPASDGAYINLYRSGSVTLNICGSDVRFDILGDYPMSGSIKIRVSAEKKAEYRLRFRIPSYCQGAKVRFYGDEFEPRQGYFEICREWQDDEIEFEFDMAVTAVYPKDIVSSTNVCDCVCFTKGPIVLATDERLCGDCRVYVPDDKEHNIDCILADVSIPCEQAYEVYASSGKSTVLIDYASAGHGQGKIRCACFSEIRK